MIYNGLTERERVTLARQRSPRYDGAPPGGQPDVNDHAECNRPDIQ